MTWNLKRTHEDLRHGRDVDDSMIRSFDDLNQDGRRNGISGYEAGFGKER